MPYRSRHVGSIGGRNPMGRYSRETMKQFQNTTLEKNEEEESQLKALHEQKIRTQADHDLWERLMRSKEERHDRRCAPLASENESYSRNLNVEPSPAPLPKSSLWLETTLPKYYDLKYIREFYIACQEGDMNTVQHWVSEKKDTLHQIGLDDGLASAARGDQVEVCRFLLNNGALLHGDVVRKACDNLSLPMFKLFFEHGYHPNQQIPSRSGGYGTALNHCLRSDDITRLLLENGADPNAAPFKDGRNSFFSERSTPPMDRRSGLPLDTAVVQGSIDVVRMLLEHGANPKWSRPFGRVACQRDGRTGEPAEKPGEWRPIMDMLLNYGADINGLSGSGTALSGVTTRRLWDVAEYMLDKGADPRVKAHMNGENALSLAAKSKGTGWEDSEEVQKYVSQFLDPKTGEAEEISLSDGVLQNPLIQIMERMREKRGGKKDHQ